MIPLSLSFSWNKTWCSGEWHGDSDGPERTSDPFRLVLDRRLVLLELVVREPGHGPPLARVVVVVAEPPGSDRHERQYDGDDSSTLAGRFDWDHRWRRRRGSRPRVRRRVVLLEAQEEGQQKRSGVVESR